MFVCFSAGKAIRSPEKRIILHSTTDVADVYTAISNLTGQLTSLTGEFAALKQEHSKQVMVLDRNLVSVQHDNTKLKSLLQEMQNNNSKLQVNNSNLQALVHALQVNNSNLQTMVQSMQTNDVNLQAIVQAMQRNDSKQNSLIQMFQRNVSNIEVTMQTVQDSLVRLQKGGSTSGSTYVRWGRNSCSGNGTETVYSGYAAGGYTNHRGAGTNHLCLASDPLWAHYNDSLDAGGKLYGAQYMMWESTSREFFAGRNIRAEDAPCSVCRTPGSSVTIIPGRNVCYKGWNLEYSGYLTSGGYSYSSSTEYICLDSHPDVISGGHTSVDNGAVLYLVDGICGTLKCPPYVNGR